MVRMIEPQKLDKNFWGSLFISKHTFEGQLILLLWLLKTS
jgi:hypothetical protein